MTPGARVAAAIELMDAILAGQSAEQALTRWARGSRFAGSGDRFAIRDLVFQALRCRRSCAAFGGAETGRGLMLGLMRLEGREIAEVFSGQGHSPAPLGEAERAAVAAPVSLSPAEEADCPDWLFPALKESLGADFSAVMAALRQRAPVFLRANLARVSREEAARMLARDGIRTRAHPLAVSCLEVTENARKVQNSEAYREGLVELQDAASQAIVERLPLSPGMKVLDYCAGGGGKTLAMAARCRADYFVHDADPGRMRDLTPRMERAGAAATKLGSEEAGRHAPYDLVLVDAPCSGSGSWRRAPEAKWRLTPERLTELTEIQSQILGVTAGMTAPGGFLAYATCSLLDAENGDRLSRFLTERSGWKEVYRQRLTPLDGGDGFFLGILLREK